MGSKCLEKDSLLPSIHRNYAYILRAVWKPMVASSGSSFYDLITQNFKFLFVSACKLESSKEGAESRTSLHWVKLKVIKLERQIIS